VSVYVAFSSCNPDEATENKALKALKDNIDVGKLMEYSADHCQQEDLSTEGGSFT
jgi:hypothetical protein